MVDKTGRIEMAGIRRITIIALTTMAALAMSATTVLAGRGHP